VARRYGLHPSQVFAWRKAAREGQIAERPSRGSFACAFAPVVVTSEAHLLPCGTITHGRMEIVLVSGHRVVVDAGVDAAALDRVITVLERR
jgi:transposase